MDTNSLTAQLLIANQEKAKLEAELILANIELDLRNEEKIKRASEMIIANEQLDGLIKEKAKRAAELVIAYTRLDNQEADREQRASELILAGTELVFQNREKEKRAAELIVVNKKLVLQNKLTEKLAAELMVANKELVFQNLEKEKRANELIIANKKLVFEHQEKAKRAAELIIANIELDFQDEEKEKRAAELLIALKELGYQDEEKGKRAAELIIANRELMVQKLENDRREVAEAKKDEFFNMVSHEFKTPLTNIKVIHQLLEKKTDKADKIYPFLANAGNSIKRLEKLIADLLDVTKINSGQIDLNVAAFYFADALTNSIATVQLAAHHHEIILENSIELLYTGDQFRIEQVLINLLTNAIKYSPNASQVIVRAQLEAKQLVVSIQDFGIGIAKADIDHLFQRFYRVSKTALQFQGVGLGLYIASEIIKKHKGSFSIQSEPGKGSTFCFHLPL
ncbi:ATP-binding protein [Mucilaginibacter sp. HD30]